MTKQNSYNFINTKIDISLLANDKRINTNWYVLTGAPCSEKTTIIEEFKQKFLDLNGGDGKYGRLASWAVFDIAHYGLLKDKINQSLTIFIDFLLYVRRKFYELNSIYLLADQYFKPKDYLYDANLYCIWYQLLIRLRGT